MMNFDEKMRNKAIGAEIRAIRKGCGLTQEKVCEILRTSQGNYAGYELGRRYISRDMCDRIIIILRLKDANLTISENIQKYLQGE